MSANSKIVRATGWAVISFAQVASVWTITDHATKREAISVARSVRGAVFRMARVTKYGRDKRGELRLTRETLSFDRDLT